MRPSVLRSLELKWLNATHQRDIQDKPATFPCSECRNPGNATLWTNPLGMKCGNLRISSIYIGSVSVSATLNLSTLYAYSASRRPIRFPLMWPCAGLQRWKREKQTQPASTSWANETRGSIVADGWSEWLHLQSWIMKLGSKLGQQGISGGRPIWHSSPVLTGWGKCYMDSPPGGQCACMLCKVKINLWMKWNLVDDPMCLLVLPFKPLPFPLSVLSLPLLINNLSLWYKTPYPTLNHPNFTQLYSTLLNPS